MDKEKIENYLDLIDKSAYTPSDISMMPALNLAYIGDCVFELLVRSKIISENTSAVNILHKRSSSFARAGAQSEMYYNIIDFLKEDELSVLKRGRNAKSQTKAKNATVSEYRHATGLEALFGYLFLKGDTKRIIELFEICTNKREKNSGEKEEYAHKENGRQ